MTQASAPSTQSPTLQSLYKLGKFFGIKTGSSAGLKKNRSLTVSSKHGGSSSKTTSIGHPSVTVSCPDDTTSTISSDVTLAPKARPTLSHSASEPTMLMHYQTPSQSSTRSATPVSGDMTPHSVMFGVEEKKMQVSGDSKLDTKRRWRWKRRNTEFIPSASPIAVRTTGSLGTHSKKSQSVRLPSSPLWDPPTRPQPATLASFPQHAEGTQLGLVATAESINSAELQAREKPRRQHFHSQSTDKLTRTLGIPSNATSVADTQTQAFDTDTSFKNEDTTKETPKLSRSRRMSLSLSTTLNSLPSLLRSPAQSPKQSRVSLSTLNTDDVHQFGLADDLSDSWGAIRDGSGTSLHSTHSPISPITFKPPTPVAAVPPGRPSAPNLPAGDKVKPDAVTSSSQRTDAALGRSRSLSFVPARIGRLVQLASANAAAQSSSAMPQEEASPSAQQDIPDEAESGLPVKANWLTSPGEEAKARSFVVRHPEYADEYKSWSGQWNQDPQHVIKMLRSLK